LFITVPCKEMCRQLKNENTVTVGERVVSFINVKAITVFHNTAVVEC